MQEIIAKQQVRRRAQIQRLDSKRLKPRVPRSDSPRIPGLSSLKALWDGIRVMPTFWWISAAGLVLIGLTAFGVSAWSHQTLFSALDAAPDPLMDRAMMSYSGMNPSGDVTITTDDGLKLTVSEIFSYEPYTVRKGDSLSNIAANNSLTIGTIIAFNNLSNAKRLSSGKVLKIPNMDGVPYKVRRGDVLGRIASSWGVPLEAILDANDLASETITPGTVLFLPGAKLSGEDIQRALGELFLYPLRGRFTSAFGWRNDPFTGTRLFHPGIDIADPIGTPIKAAMDGRVSAIGNNAVYGNFIILSHSGSYQTMYAHMSAFKVGKGELVSQGQRIGLVGSTGRSTGPHLHFGVYKNGRALNPMQFLSN